MTDEDNEEGGGRPSKSARKREAESLQRLGVELSELTAEEITALALPEKLQIALLDLKRLPGHGAKVRQRQYIGKLMRGIDATPLVERLEAKKRTHDHEVRHFQKIERWRDRLLADDAVLSELLLEHTTADGAQLRSLIGRARQEREEQHSPAAARELFAILRRLLEEAGKLPP